MSRRQVEVRLIPVETRLPEGLYERLAAEAKANERSLAAELRRAVKAYLKVAA